MTSGPGARATHCAQGGRSSGVLARVLWDTGVDPPGLRLGTHPERRSLEVLRSLPCTAAGAAVPCTAAAAATTCTAAAAALHCTADGAELPCTAAAAATTCCAEPLLPRSLAQPMVPHFPAQPLVPQSPAQPLLPQPRARSFQGSCLFLRLISQECVFKGLTHSQLCWTLLTRPRI